MKTPELSHFISPEQMGAIAYATMGVDREDIEERFRSVLETICEMPALYAQEGKGDDAVVFLHYFKGSSDWFVTELDPVTETAFGYVILNGNTELAELGYIQISELVQANAEIDLYWERKTLGECKAGNPVKDEDSLFQIACQRIHELTEANQHAAAHAMACNLTGADFLKQTFELVQSLQKQDGFLHAHLSAYLAEKRQHLYNHAQNVLSPERYKLLIAAL